VVTTHSHRRTAAHSPARTAARRHHPPAHAPVSPGGFAVVLCLAFCLAGRSPALAIEELEAEENIAELLPSKFPGADRVRDFRTRPWAVLPEFGYGPDTSLLGGLKFAHRDLFHRDLTFDIEGLYSINNNQIVNVSLGAPHLWEDRVLVLFRAKYVLDPQRDFFDFGNNDFGPDPVSTHEFQDIGGGLTVGWRPFRRLAFNLGIGLRQVDIRDGDRLDECNGVIPCPFTRELSEQRGGFPGIDGGVINPLSFSLVWNTRDDIMRPTRGFRVILKIVAANHAFSDFKFQRYFVDIGYLRAFFAKRVIFGVRLNGEYNDSNAGQVPFWELAELGGQDTLRGFFPHRFLGDARVLLNGELRAKLFEFDFFKLWRVKVDGVAFGDGGRVFIDGDELADEFNLDSEILSRIFDNFQYSFGGGLRFALSEALIARVDVGFSDEYTALVYLAFGHTF
jgi:outer membrane protein assembly factor BamA